MNVRFAIIVGAVLACNLDAQTGSVRIRVVDRNGAAIVTSKASLLRADDKPIRSETATDTGEIVLTGVPVGFSRFTVSAPGFTSRELAVTVRDGVERRIDASLDVAPIEQEPNVKTVQMPSAEALDPTAEPPTKPTKRRWWQIFR